MNSLATSRNSSPKHSKKTITQNLQKNLHKHKNLQSKNHYDVEFQITKKGFEITKTWVLYPIHKLV
jgi:hypothetical protein